MNTTEDVHEKIAKLSINKFNSLPKTGKPTSCEWTVLSTITKSQDGKNLEVVALATGSKCIGASQMTSRGDILHDSHAEILCRRAFLRYLYSELTKEDIFEANDDKKFVLKAGVAFHFFTTHAPCGDAAIFLKNISGEDIEFYGDENNTVTTKCVDEINHEGCSKRKNSNVDTLVSKKLKLDEDLDIYRTGAKCVPHGENLDSKHQGIQYHTLGAIRTKPGRGDPTLSLSCSDKIAKWCHVGVQGALLSRLISKPIYLTTFTIIGGTPFDNHALERALYNRFIPCDLIEPYKQHKMTTKQATSTFQYAKDDEKQPCPASIIYSKVQERSLEVAVDGRKQGVIKKNLLKKAGRLSVCKLELFRLFQQHNAVNDTYAVAKAVASEYMQNFNIFKNMARAWTIKDNKLFNFRLIE